MIVKGGENIKKGKLLLIILSLIFILSSSGLIYAQDVDDIVLTHQISTSDSQPSIDISQDTLSSRIDEISYNNDSDLGTTKNECVDKSDASSANEQNSLINPQEKLFLNSNLKLSEYYVNQNSIMFDKILGITNDNVLTYAHTYDLEPFHDAVRNYLSQFEEVSGGSTYSGGGSQQVHVYWAPLYPIEGNPVTIVVDVQNSFKSVKISVGGHDYQMTPHDNGQYFTYTIANPSAASGLDINPQGSSHATISEFHVYHRSSISLNIDKNTITIGDKVRLTPTVVGITSGSDVTVGTVTYYLSDGTRIGTSAPNGYLDYTPVSSGDYTFYAEYAPDTSDVSHLYQPCTSNNVNLKVNPKTPTVGISVTSVTYPNRAVATVTTNASGTYSVVINGKSYSLTFSSSQTSRTLNVDLLPPHLNMMHLYHSAVIVNGQLLVHQLLSMYMKVM